jgi:hypothetical protein
LAYDRDNRLIRKTYADAKGLSFRDDADGPWADDTLTYAFDALLRRTNRYPPPSRQPSAI